MQSALKFTVPILSGRRIEISSPDLPESGEVELIVVLPETEGHARSDAPCESVVEYLRSLPVRSYTADEWEAVEAELQEGRNSWER